MKDSKKLMTILKTLTVLYIEDENNIRNELTKTLQLLCKDVYPFPNAKSAFEFYKNNQVDIILSDISLGETSGLEFASKIREENYKVPIILLSAHTNTDYLLKASSLKLVDYLVKPITFLELQGAFLKAVDEIVRENNLEVRFTNNIYYDLNKKLLYENGEIKKLSHSETLLLDLFIKNKKRTLTMDEIKNLIWDDPYDATDNAFKSLIHKLRLKIGKDTIQNISGIGYYITTL